jgi:hypothetical protein
MRNLIFKSFFKFDFLTREVYHLEERLFSRFFSHKFRETMRAKIFALLQN